jgi:hypothetical protein
MDNLTTWVDHHGFLVILLCFIFATVMSSAPKETPKWWGFWKTWAFNAFQALGANAGNYAKANPVIQRLQASETDFAADGTKVQTDTTISSTVTPPPAKAVLPTPKT